MAWQLAVAMAVGSYISSKKKAKKVEEQALAKRKLLAKKLNIQTGRAKESEADIIKNTQLMSMESEAQANMNKGSLEVALAESGLDGHMTDRLKNDIDLGLSRQLGAISFDTRNRLNEVNDGLERSRLNAEVEGMNITHWEDANKPSRLDMLTGSINSAVTGYQLQSQFSGSFNTGGTPATGSDPLRGNTPGQAARTAKGVSSYNGSLRAIRAN